MCTKSENIQRIFCTVFPRTIFIQKTSIPLYSAKLHQSDHTTKIFKDLIIGPYLAVTFYGKQPENESS